MDASNAEWDTVRWRTANSRQYAGATWPAQDGWVPEFYYVTTRYDRWFSAPCSFTGFTPPEPFAVHGPVASTTTCYQHPGPDAQVHLLYGWAAENALGAPGPIEDYTNQPYTKSSPAPTPPPQATVEQSIETELEKPENALLRQWLNYQLGSPGEEDPLGIDEPNPEIEFPGWFEHWEDHGHKFTPAYDDPMEYWRDAADIVERYENDPDILRCPRSDGALIYWDPDKEAIVIVKDGKIVTYYPPATGFEYWLGECDK